jgi:hypothetical protein
LYEICCDLWMPSSTRSCHEPPLRAFSFLSQQGFSQTGYETKVIGALIVGLRDTTSVIEGRVRLCAGILFVRLMCVLQSVVAAGSQETKMMEEVGDDF